MFKNSKFLIIAATALITVSGCKKENPAEHIITQERIEGVLRYIGDSRNVDPKANGDPGPLENTVASMNRTRNIRASAGFMTRDGTPIGDAKFSDVTVKSCTTEPDKDKPDTENIKCNLTYVPVDGVGKSYPMKNAKIEMLRQKSGKITIVRFNE